MSEPASRTEAALEADRRVGTPTPLRLAGFLATVLGALALGVGATMKWVVVPRPAKVTGNVELVYRGLDLTAGKVAVAAALVLLVGLMALRGARTRAGEKAVAIAILIAGVAGIAATSFVLFTADSRYGLPDQPHVTREVGLYIALAGAVLGTIGGVLDLMWATAPAES